MALWLAGSGIHPAGAQTGSPTGSAKEIRRLPLLPAEEAWLVTLTASPLAGGAMDADRVYIPLGPRRVDAVPQPGSEQVVALDRQTGEQRWARELASPWPPVAANDRVFLAARDGIHALDAATGTSVWHVQLAGTVVAAPAAGDGLIVVMTTAEGLLALRAEDGAAAWKLPLGVSDGPAALTVDAGAVYLSFDANVVRASLRDGSRMWSQKLTGTLGPPATGRDRVFVGSTDNYLYALDADDGDFEWRYPAGADVIGAAAKGDTVFFVALDNVLRALNRGSGNQRWKSLLETRASAPPRVFDGIVLVPGLTPALATFALDTGAPLGMYTAASDLIGAALVDADLKPFRVAIVAITGEGRVAGLRPAEMTLREPPSVPLQELPGAALAPDQFPAPRQP